MAKKPRTDRSQTPCPVNLVDPWTMSDATSPPGTASATARYRWTCPNPTTYLMSSMPPTPRRRLVVSNAGDMMLGELFADKLLADE